MVRICRPTKPAFVKALVTTLRVAVLCPKRVWRTCKAILGSGKVISRSYFCGKPLSLCKLLVEAFKERITGSWEVVKLGNIKTEFIYKGQSHRSKSLMIFCVSWHWNILLLPSFCDITVWDETRMRQYKLSPKSKARKRPGNRTTCSLCKHFIF